MTGFGQDDGTKTVEAHPDVIGMGWLDVDRRGMID